MGNIVSYLKWRGDLDFKERKFSDADNLVLSALAYTDFSGIVPEVGEPDEITVEDAMQRYFDRKFFGECPQLRDKSGTQTLSEWDVEQIPDTSYEKVLYYMGQSRRYKNAKLSAYREHTDEVTQTQFAAVRIGLDDGTYYLAYRGTDETIVGWQEDFSISYQVVPAQEEALNWLEETMAEDNCIYRIGGHSKGGNLAVYAAAMCKGKYKGRILQVYTNDGPGLCEELLGWEHYNGIRSKITRIIPGFCIIGKLFEPDIPPVIIESNAKGILQHDIMTWQLSGDQLCTRQLAEPGSGFYNDIFDTWIESADMKQREVFTRDFFDALRAGGAQTIPQIAESGVDGFGTVLLSIVNSESRTKIVIGKFLKSCVEHFRELDLKKLLQSKEGLRASAVIVAGVLCFLVPELAVRSIGLLLSFLGFLWSGKKILEYADNPQMAPAEKRNRLLVCMGILSLMVFLITHHKVILISGNILIGLVLMAFACRLLRLAAKKSTKQWKQIGTAVGGVLLFLLGIVSVVTPEAVFVEKMFVIGSCMILYGLGTYIRAIFRESCQAYQ